MRKKENFKKAFNQFDYEKVAHYGEEKIEVLVKNKDFIRNKQKIKAAVNNAQYFISNSKKYGTFS